MAHNPRVRADYEIAHTPGDRITNGATFAFYFCDLRASPRRIPDKNEVSF
jgi:hypothetical protein